MVLLEFERGINIGMGLVIVLRHATKKAGVWRTASVPVGMVCPKSCVLPGSMRAVAVARFWKV